MPVFLAYPAGSALRVEATNPRRPIADLHVDSGRGGLSTAIAVALAGTGARVFHVHSVELGATAIVDAAVRTGVPLVVTLHDHGLVCENYALLERGERFCDVPDDLSRCDRCLAATRGRPAGSLATHRADAAELVRRATRFVAPSGSVLALVSRVHPGIGPKSTQMAWGIPLPSARSTARAQGAPRLSVAVVGMHWGEKGRDRLPDLLRACKTLPIDFHLFGATEGRPTRDLVDAAPSVRVHGAYSRPELATRLVDAGVHLAVLPSTKPETFSLVLSEVIAAGVPVIGSDLGALSERIRGDRLGFVFDPWAPETLSSLLADLDRDRIRVDAVARHVRTLPVRTEAEMLKDHVDLWSSVAEGAKPASDPALLAAFEAARAAARAPSRLLEWVEAARATDFYRDLPLRTLLPESTRKRVLDALGARLERKRRS